MTPPVPLAHVPTWLASGRPPAVTLVLVYITYLLATGFGRWITVLPGIPISIWPPNGVILALLLTEPRRTWPWWIAVGAAGELTGNVVWFANPIGPALGYVAANASAITLAAFLLGPLMRTPIRRLTTLSQVMAFLCIGVLVAPAISATLGSAIGHVAGGRPFVDTWPVWWLGDATGILLATPLAISTVNALRERALPDRRQLLEGCAIALVLGGLGAWAMATDADYAFLLPLPVLWAALRFEFRGATLAVLGLSLVIGLHAQGIDTALVPADVAAHLHSRLQALILAAASTGLIVAAISRQQRRAVSDLGRANIELEARVAERTRDIEAAERRFQATFENAGVGISIVDGNGLLLRVNDSLTQMLGHEPQDMEGRPLDQFTHPDDRARGEAALTRLRSGEADDYDLEKRYIRKDGELVWGHTTVSCVRGPDGRIAYLIKIIQDITERKRSDEARDILAREVNHRSKNLLAIVQAIARRTKAQSQQEFVEIFGKRLQALAANQDLLVRSGWQRISLAELMQSQLEHFGAIGSRFALSGPQMMLPPQAAQALGMALHELATNAVKYGSLSNQTGRVEIAWSVADDTFRMSWRESGGPEVTAPEGSGFGTTVLKTMTETSLSGAVSIDFPTEGFVWQLQCPLSAFREPATAGASG